MHFLRLFILVLSTFIMFGCGSGGSDSEPEPGDVTRPVISILGANPLKVALGSIYIDPGATAFDAEDDKNVTVKSTGVVNTSTEGYYTITYTAQDAAGNQASEQRVVQVLDTNAPLISIHGDNPVYILQGEVYSDAGATATDLEDGNLSVITTADINTSIIGEQLVVYRATDSNNTTTTEIRTVHITESEAPTLTILGPNPLSIAINVAYHEFGAVATHSSEGNLSVTFSGSVDSNTSGDYFITYTSKNQFGNEKNTTRVVNVIDTDAPVITLYGDNPLYMEPTGEQYVDAGAYATDSQDGNITVFFDDNISVHYLRTTSIIFVATDSDGNETTIRREIVVTSNHDSDNDGINRNEDNCDDVYNPNQLNSDGDRYGDACDDDDDNDGRTDNIDIFPFDPTEWADSDGDGIGNNSDRDNDGDNILDEDDNCQNTPNSDQIDTDIDGVGDACDIDIDNDNTHNAFDDFPYDANETLDTDGDGIGNNADNDDDNDTYLDDNDTFPLDGSEWADIDGDGIGNNSDLDNDNDRMPNSYEVANGLDPYFANANEDNDGDFVRNHDEYRSDTNATDANSYTPFHIKSWTQQLGTHSSDTAYRVANDSEGNIYIVGADYGVLENTNYSSQNGFVHKFNTDGQKIWTKHIGTLENDYLKNITIDSSDNIYVTGYTNGSIEDANSTNGSTDILVAKLNKAGDSVWIKQWGTQETDLGFAVESDTDGNIYVVGTTDGNFTQGENNSESKDIFLTKLNPLGDILWTQQWFQTSHFQAYNIALDTQKNIYISGNHKESRGSNTPVGPEEIFLAKFNNQGEEVWKKIYAGQYKSSSSYTLKVDINNSIYIAGYVKESYTTDNFIAKVDSNGSEQWMRVWSSDKEYHDRVSNIILNSSGHIYVTGYTKGPYEAHNKLGDNDIFLSKLDANGDLLWSKVEGTEEEDSGLGITIDSNENIFIVGRTKGQLNSEANSDIERIFLLKFLLVTNSLDIDNDSILNAVDNCPKVPNSDQNNSDGDSQGDMCDSDIDNDDVNNSLDAFPYDNTESLDTDGDGIGNNTDNDDDNDTLSDTYETLNGLNPLKDDAFSDKDRDGAYNYGEYIEGTDPSNIASVPAYYKYDSMELWTSSFHAINEANSVDSDSNNNIYVAGNTATDAYLVKFDTNSTQVWTKKVEDSQVNTSGYSVTVDKDNNIILIGTIGTESFVYKYNSDGDIIWSQQWHLVHNNTTIIKAVTTDIDGDIYIAGYYIGYSGDKHMFVRKLTSDGSRRWDLNWTTSIAQINDMIIDDTRTLYIAGRVSDSFNPTTSLGSSDMFLMKISGSGYIDWTKQFGTQNSDSAHALIKDENGNFYVTGLESSLTSLYKLDAQGNLLWNRTWKVTDYGEVGDDIVIDPQGYIHVLSDTKNLIKFNSSGDRISRVASWYGSYDRQYINAATIDSNGLLYLVGKKYNSMTNSNSSLLRKYTLFSDKDADTIVDSQDNCPNVSNLDQNNTDNDAEGDVCDSDIDGDNVGNGVDAFPYDATETADSDGDGIGNNADSDDDNDGMPDIYENANGLNSTHNDTTLDADSDGVNNLTEYKEGTDPQSADSKPFKHELKWTKQLGSSSYDFANSVAYDQNGSIYVTGKTRGALDGNSNSGLDDIYLTKYDINGTKIWTKQWGTDKTDEGKAIAIDAQGDIYIVGSTQGSLDNSTSNSAIDAFISKFDSSGTQLWTKQWGSSSETDEANALAVASSGDIYITGYTNGSLTGQTNLGSYDIFLTIFSSDGTLKSTNQWGTSASDVATAIAVDSNNSFYVTGNTSGAFSGFSASGGSDTFVTKVRTSGIVEWTQQFASSDYIVANAITTDTFNHLYITGRISGNIDTTTVVGNNDSFLLKLENNGTKVWSKQFGTTEFDDAQGVVTDRLGNIYVTGYVEESLDGQTHSGSQDIYVTKVDADSTTLWSIQYGTTASDMANAIAIDNSFRTLFVVGTTTGALEGNTNAGVHDSFISKLVMHRDNDSIDDSIDNCPTIPNQDQSDSDNNGVGDVCDIQ